MKKTISIILILFFAIELYSQENDFKIITLFPQNISEQKEEKELKHEVRLSYGIETFPNFHLYNLLLGGFTANYTYRLLKWFWVGANINWQFPSDINYYRWAEYYADGSVKYFEIAERNKFLAISPEIRLSFTNTKRATLYAAFSAGYGIYTGIKKEDMLNYWFWNITLFGANFNIGKKENIIAGLEIGLGFKGTASIHLGYRF